MNSTNRAANRLLLAITGILLIAAGAAGGALLAVSDVAKEWSGRVRDVAAQLPSWTGIAVAAGALILIILLVVFVARQGRGHTGRLLEQRGDTASTLLDLGVPRALLEEHLGGRPEFVATRVSAYRVKRTAMLKVSLQCRRGVTPADAARLINEALVGLDAVLGIRIPALVQLSGGFRNKIAKPSRVG